MSQIFYSLKNTIQYINNNDTLTTHINIGYGIDDKYSRAVASSIVSICLNNPQSSFNFHIIADNLSSDTKIKFKQLSKKYFINIYIYEIDISYLKKLPILNHYSTAIYFRLLFPLLLKNYKQFIYLDADIICINNIQKVLTLKLETHIIAAVPDVFWTSNQRLSELKLDNHVYFNSGMLIINIDKWNKFNISNKIIELLNNTKYKFSHPDQDALNILLTKKIFYLDEKFNCINMNNINLSNTCLLHFAAKSKPWHLSWSVSPSCNKNNINIYSHYEKLTPWSNYDLETPKNYKQMHFYAKCLKKHHFYLKSILWYLKYSYHKALTIVSFERRQL